VLTLKLKKKIKVGIDSPSAAGAGTISKMLAEHYNLLYCDTGKIYRYLAKELMREKPKNRIFFLKKISKKINLKKLKNKNLLDDKVAFVASQIAKDLRIRKLVLTFQKSLAYNPPASYNGSLLDGRDICSVVIKDADFKFYVTASVKIRALRRYKELKKLGKKVKFDEILKSMKKRDREDRTRKHSKLKITEESILINTSQLSIKNSFLKVKKIMDRKLKLIWKKQQN
jgi:CMP/dCMP kinase